MSVKTNTIKNSTWDFLSKIVNKIGAIIFTIILARFLLPEGFGIYSLSLSIAIIFTSFIDSSLNNTLIRYVSYALKNKKREATDYFKYLLRIRFWFSFLVSLLLIFLAYPLSNYVFNKPQIFVPLFVLGFYIFVISLETFYDSLFYIFGKVKIRVFKETIKQLLRIFLTLLVFFLVAKSYYVVGVIFGLILTNLIILLFTFSFIKKFAKILFQKKKKINIDKKRVSKYFFYMCFISVSGLVFMYIDTIMIGLLVPDVSYVGFYNSAINLIWGITGMLSFAFVFLPVFTQAAKQNLANVFNKIMKYYYLLVIPIAFGITVLSKYIIFVIYGREYLSAALSLSILSFLIIEIIISSSISTLLSAREKIKKIMKIMLILIFLNIVLNFILIKFFLMFSQLWAMNGAAIATLLSRYIYMFFMISLMKKELNIKLEANWKKPLAISLLMFSILFFLNVFILKDMNLIFGILEVLLGIGIYFSFMFLFKGISKRDIKELKFQ